MRKTLARSCPNIAFVIVTYNEEFFRCSAYMSLFSSIMANSGWNNYLIYIYDNSDKPDWQIHYQHLKEADHIRYFHNPHNPGISVAYNDVARNAQKEGCEWFILFDQDTTLPIDAVQKYKDAIAERPEWQIKAPILHLKNSIFSPHRTFLGRSSAVKSIEPGIYSFRELRVVNSGLAIYLPLFLEVGGYNEKIKLDFADFQFLSRIQKKINKFQLLSINCLQDFSHDEPNVSKALKRFAIYIKDYRNCELDGTVQTLQYALLAFTHTLKLTIKFKTVKFLNLYFA